MFNPSVLRRELLDRLRATRTFFSVLACALLTCLLVWMRWPTESRMEGISQGSLQVFQPLAYSLAAAVMLLVPAFPATAMVKERRRGTLALLVNSPLSQWEIYLGKLLSNFLLAAMIVSVSLPALAAAYAMGGVSFNSQIVPLLLVLLALSLQIISIGLWVSSQSASSDSSLRWTYAAVLGIVVLTLAPAAILGGVDTIQAQLAQWLTQLSPMGALRQLTSTQSATAELQLAESWQGFVIAALISSGIFGALTLRTLDPYKYDRPKATGIITQDRSRTGRWFRRVHYLVDPQSRKAGIPWWLNPVMVKEFRTRKFGRLHWLIRLVALCSVISLGLTIFAATGTVSWGVVRIAGTLVLLQVSLLILLGPSLAAGLIAAERESGGWQLLRMTPMSPVRIVIGKLMSVVWTMALILLATLPGYAVMMWIEPTMTTQVQRVVLSLVVCALMIISISAAVSAFWQNAAAATATSYGVLLSLFLGTMLIWLARGRPFGHDVIEQALRFNPAAAALAEIRTPYLTEYVLLPHAWWIGIGISLASLLILAYRVWRLCLPD